MARNSIENELALSNIVKVNYNTRKIDNKTALLKNNLNQVRK